MNVTENNIDLSISTNEYSDVVASIYDAVQTGEWSVPLDRIIEVTQSNKAFFFVHDVGSIEPVLMKLQSNFVIPPGILEQYHARPFDEPFYAINAALSEAESIDINKNIAFEEFVGSDYHKKLFVPFRTHYALSGCLIRDGECESAWAINRGPDDPPYTPQDMNFVTLITTHLSRAVSMYRNLRLYKHYASLNQRIMDQTERGLIVCDENANIIISNIYANELIDSNEFLSFDDNRFSLLGEEENQLLAKYIRQSARFSFSGIEVQESITLKSDDGGDVFITVTPLQRHDDLEDRKTAAALITLSSQDGLQWGLVTTEFQLTPRQLQLVKAVYSRRRLSDLTEEFGVTYNTLRTHLQAIFKKLQVNSQTELIAKLGLFKG